MAVACASKTPSPPAPIGNRADEWSLLAPIGVGEADSVVTDVVPVGDAVWLAVAQQAPEGAVGRVLEVRGGHGTETAGVAGAIQRLVALPRGFVALDAVRGRLAIGAQQIRQKLGMAPRHPRAPAVPAPV